MDEVGIRILPRWPGYSPDLNPQENVWPWMQRQLNARDKSLQGIQEGSQGRGGKVPRPEPRSVHGRAGLGVLGEAGRQDTSVAMRRQRQTVQARP